jgi:hypothetical protein
VRVDIVCNLDDVASELMAEAMRPSFSHDRVRVILRYGCVLVKRQVGSTDPAESDVYPDRTGSEVGLLYVLDPGVPGAM